MSVLNLKLCGLYFVDVGNVSDLCATMDLDKIEYPPERYGPYHIWKLVFAKDIPERYKCLNAGYGRFIPNIGFKWILLISRCNLETAERRLNKLVDEYAMNLHFRRYWKLVIYDLIREDKLKNIYSRTADEFPCLNFDKKLTEIQLIIEVKFVKKEIELKDVHAKEVPEYLATILELEDAYTKEVTQLRDAHVNGMIELKCAHAEFKETRINEVNDLLDAQSKECANDVNEIPVLERLLLYKNMEI